MKIIVLGISGMLGSTAFRELCKVSNMDVYGTARKSETSSFFDDDLRNRITTGIDVEDFNSVVDLFTQIKPEVVINCVGVVKQLASAKDPLTTVPINTILPHRLAPLGCQIGARLIHVSTDCVFSGKKGNYKESDFPDADDLYGRSKLLGEVDYRNAITLRTSIVGRELDSRHGLIEWFLHEKGCVRGYRRAIFSGLITQELTRVMVEHVLPRPELHGVYHVSSAPINKYDLLQLVKSTYGLDTEIQPDDSVVIDRSLNS